MVVPQTPLFSAKILQEDKDMWLDVQVQASDFTFIMMKYKKLDTNTLRFNLPANGYHLC
jgi:hypothetical protein